MNEQLIEPQKSTLKIFDPTDTFGQIDYRQNPSAGNRDEREAPVDYDHPFAPEAHPTQPWTDQTWVAADEATDAIRFRGINEPAQQAEYHLSPNPKADWQGWSPALPDQLAWERQVSGAPPPYAGDRGDER